MKYAIAFMALAMIVYVVLLVAEALGRMAVGIGG